MFMLTVKFNDGSYLHESYYNKYEAEQYVDANRSRIEEYSIDLFFY